MMRNIKFIDLVITNDGKDCHRFFSDIFDGNKSESSVERNQHFCSSAFLMEIIFGHRIIQNECNFLLNRSEVSKSSIFCYEETEKESIVSENYEQYEISHLLRLSGRSRKESCSSFSGMKSTEVLEIDDSIDTVRIEDFKYYRLLTQVVFHHRVI
jgi:hypothetical protein